MNFYVCVLLLLTHYLLVFLQLFFSLNNFFAFVCDVRRVCFCVCVCVSFFSVSLFYFVNCGVNIDECTSWSGERRINRFVLLSMVRLYRRSVNTYWLNIVHTIEMTATTMTATTTTTTTAIAATMPLQQTACFSLLFVVVVRLFSFLSNGNFETNKWKILHAVSLCSLTYTRASIQFSFPLPLVLACSLAFSRVPLG